ncbi:MAG TPA: hypothetical protein VH740_07360 [Vicinamibacterales bacterium]|jgi:hypothetical protein
MPTWRLEVSSAAGAIALCPHMGCAFRCCDAKQAGEILLYPGELEEVAAQGRSTNHLEILDANYFGGARVKCRAKDTATCDGGHKPLDCSSYPFFPKLPASPRAKKDSSPILTKGVGCPIAGPQIPAHAHHVRDTWTDLITKRSAVAAWLKAIWADGDDSDDIERYDPVGS